MIPTPFDLGRTFCGPIPVVRGMSRIANLTLTAAVALLGLSACGTAAGPAGRAGPASEAAPSPGRGGPVPTPGSTPDSRPSDTPSPSPGEPSASGTPGTPATPIPPDLIGTWLSIGATGVPLLPDRPVRMTIVEDRFGLAPGCNRMGGDFRVAGAELWVERFMGTMMGCEAPVMEQERSVTKLFSERAAWKRVDHRLTVSRGDQSITFERVAEHQKP
ncbi:META domain-containing protein [Mariniluteicoccus flavus]